MFPFLERIFCLIVAGGNGPASFHVEAITGDLGMILLPNLPKKFERPSMVLHDGAISLCGGSNNGIIGSKCLQLDHGTWKNHSTLNQDRFDHSAVRTQTATFIFGGSHSRETYEYLPKGSSTWVMGRRKIPGGFWYGCAIAVKSDQEIWLIGGVETEQRILSFNVHSHIFRILPFQLSEMWSGHSCAFIPNTNKVMITGSFGNSEILNTEDGSVTLASPMNVERTGHGMGVLTIKGEDRLAVFGGYNSILLDSVETYNAKSAKWETTDIKLNGRKYEFGYLTVKLGDIIFGGLI